MKIVFASILGWNIIALSVTQAAALSRERQIEIIENYMYVTGQTTQLPSQALEAGRGFPEQLPLKCGTPAVADFVLNRDKLDKDLLLSLGVNLETRPTYSEPHFYDSPSGLFKVHYTTSGIDSVYRPSDDRDSDGVPDYVEDVAVILDSVYDHEINILGYPTPPVDGFYPSGGDEKYDVYIKNLLSGVFGLTYLDSLSIDGPGSLRATSFIELENDYREMAEYRNRPLDAARVTCAHEFFHAVQFGIDFTEADIHEDVVRRYWMEMSAVWMEEEIYDNINDYYSYLPFFYNNPRLSIQQFNSATDLHPYGSVVFPIFLSEKFGRDIIKDIWLRCGAMGAGPHFLIATELAIDSIIGGTLGLPTAFCEFALWNYFTGERAYYAPEGIGYSEREMYPAIHDTAIVEHTEYPFLQLGNENPRNPEHNSATYLRFHRTRDIRYDTTFWICNNLFCDTTFWICNNWSLDSCTDSTQVFDTALGYDFKRIDSSCTDSTQVFDTTFGYDMMHIDSLLSMYVFVGDGHHSIPPQPWGLNVVFKLDVPSDSFIVDNFFLPYAIGSLLDIINPNQYQSVTMIVSPASYVWQAYFSSSYDFSLGYSVPEEILIDPGLVNRPAAILVPYPNPAVVADMVGTPLKFKFQIPTDSLTNYTYPSPHFIMDVFNVAGEFVRTVDTTVTPDPWDEVIEFVAEWDMKNERGREVASGVYIAVARLYSAAKKKVLLAEDRVKVAIIR